MLAYSSILVRREISDGGEWSLPRMALVAGRLAICEKMKHNTKFVKISVG